MKHIYLISLLLLNLNVFGQEDHEILDANYMDYGLESGLASSDIYSLGQDSTGFIYVGTGFGFYKFDGLKFREIENPYFDGNYFRKAHDINFNYLKDEVIFNSNYGLFSYSHLLDSVYLIDTINVQDVYLDKTSDCIFYSGIDNGYKLRSYSLKDRSKTDLKDTSGFTIGALTMSEENNNILYFIGNGRLNQLNLTSGSFDEIKLKVAKEWPISGFVSDMLILNEMLYLSTDGDGLIKYDLNKGIEELYSYLVDKSISSTNYVNKIIKIDSSIILLTTEDEGIVYFNTISETFSYNEYNSRNELSLKKLFYRNAFLDKEKNLWLGSKEGLFLKCKEKNHFSRKDYKTPHGVNKKSIREFDLVKFRDSLIFQSARNANQFFIYDFDGNFKDEKYKHLFDTEFNVSSFANYKDQYILSFDKENIYLIDPFQKEVSIIIKEEEIEEIETGFSKIEILEDQLVVKTAYSILFFDLLNDFKLLSIESVKDKSFLFGIIIQNATLFAWTSNGLFERTAQNKYKKIVPFSNQYYSKTKRPFGALIKGKHEIVFTTNFQGLIVYNVITQESYIIGKKDGTKTDAIIEASIDEDENIWGLSILGLVLYNQYTKNANVFNEFDGLSKTDLRFSRICNLGNGKFAISIDGGIHMFDAKEMHLKDSAKAINIYSVNNQNFSSLRFPYKTPTVEFDFSNFDFGNDQNVVYQYKLNKESWQPANSTGKVILSALGSGNYSFKLRGVDMYGREARSNIIDFIIITPWWKSGWFIGLLFIFLLVLAYILIQLINVPKRELKKVETEYQGLTKDLENQVLRAQMNPHFLFNSLNSIRYFILNKDTKKAASYLTKFSRLIRLILEHSSEDVISLASELEMIKLYVDLEQVRFEGKFDFIYDVSTSSSKENLFIPPMIIQPFLENAILHGINAKKNKAILQLRIVEEEHNLFIQILDDGIGRKRAKELKAKNSLKQKSLGMNITEKRLRLISEKYPSVLRITDLNGGSLDTGTKVEIRISKLNARPI